MFASNAIKKFLILLIIFFYSQYTIANSYYQEELIEFPNTSSVTKLIQLIQAARKNIIISMYRIENKKIIESIINAQKRGIEVKIILCNYKQSDKFSYEGFQKKTFIKLKENKKAFENFAAHNIKITFSDHNTFFAYHPKFIVIDNKLAIISTSNLNDNGFLNARNFMLITKDEKIINELTELFYIDFTTNKHTKTYNHIAVSPGNYYDELFNIINSATRELYIYQTTLAHKPTCNKLQQLANKGISIKILTSKKLMQNYSTNDLIYCENILKNHQNIKYKYLNTPYYIHAKVVVSDPKEKHKSCFIGSSLFWDEGFTKSREVGIVSTNRNTINKILYFFKKDFSAANYEYEGTKNLD